MEKHKVLESSIAELKTEIKGLRDQVAVNEEEQKQAQAMTPVVEHAAAAQTGFTDPQT